MSAKRQQRLYLHMLEEHGEELLREAIIMAEVRKLRICLPDPPLKSDSI